MDIFSFLGYCEGSFQIVYRRFVNSFLPSRISEFTTFKYSEVNRHKFLQHVSFTCLETINKPNKPNKQNPEPEFLNF